MGKLSRAQVALAFTAGFVGLPYVFLMGVNPIILTTLKPTMDELRARAQGPLDYLKEKAEEVATLHTGGQPRHSNRRNANSKADEVVQDEEPSKQLAAPRSTSTSIDLSKLVSQRPPESPLK